MFGRKKTLPSVDPGQYLPQLRAYAKEHYKKPEEKKHSPPSGFRFSKASVGEIRYSISDDGLHDEFKTMMSSIVARKDFSALGSPAMKKYYHSWEKKTAVTKTFSSEVMRLVKERYRKASAFYLPAGIDKRTFHKIRTDYLYKPSKNTALKCCFGLKLGKEDAEKLLKLAGYALSPSDASDLVVLFCLEKEIWDVSCVNYLMDSFELKDLDGFIQQKACRHLTILYKIEQ